MGNIEAHHSKGFIYDEQAYIDSYLKRIQGFYSKVSSGIILGLSAEKNLRGFLNYARDRIDREEQYKQRK